MSQRAAAPAAAARRWGCALTGLAGIAAVLLAVRWSWTDYPAGDAGSGLGPAERTPYPPMLPALLAAIAVAGMIGAFRPASARAAAVVAALAALQAGGIALVARRDWWNFAGAGGASPERAAAGSRLAAVMIAAAAAAVVISALLYRTGSGERRPSRVRIAGALTGGGAVAAGVPLLLCAHWNYTSATAAGQFALWWSLPWAAGIVAAGTLRDPEARQAAAAGVVASVLLALLCVTAPPLAGFGIRLPG